VTTTPAYVGTVTTQSRLPTSDCRCTGIFLFKCTDFVVRVRVCMCVCMCLLCLCEWCVCGCVYVCVHVFAMFVWMTVTETVGSKNYLRSWHRFFYNYIVFLRKKECSVFFVFGP
jgi:hypothetical protein